MITVFKYGIDKQSQLVELPVGAEILSVAFQRGALFMWAKVDDSVDKEHRRFHVVGTGDEIADGYSVKASFIGAAHMNNGLVFHVFERYRGE